MTDDEIRAILTDQEQVVQPDTRTVRLATELLETRAMLKEISSLYESATIVGDLSPAYAFQQIGHLLGLNPRLEEQD